MTKALCFFGLAVAVLILLVFGLDVAIGKPFGKLNPIMDIAMIVFSGCLGYVSWSALKGIKT